MRKIKETIGNDYASDFTIESIIRANDNPAKNLSDDIFTREFAKALTIVIDAYFGATNGTSIITIQECADIFRQKYNNLAIDEIKLAARYSVEDELKNKTYFGQFTCALFVEIMSRYIQYRLSIKKALKTALNAKLENEQNMQTEIKKKIEFEKLANHWINERLKQNDIHDYKEIPFAMANYWYQRIEQDNKLKWYSMDLAKQEMENERVDNFYKGNLLKADHIYRALNNKNQDAIVSYAKPIYMRLLVLNYIRKNITLPNDPEKNGKEESPEF